MADNIKDHIVDDNLAEDFFSKKRELSDMEKILARIEKYHPTEVQVWYDYKPRNVNYIKYVAGFFIVAVIVAVVYRISRLKLF